MSTIIELLNYPFMQRALICGISISFCAALIGVILVLKNYSMIGHGLGEVGFAALSLALVLGLPEMYVAIPIVIIASFIILLISQKKGASGDVTIALVSTAALAFGVIITSISKGFNIDVYNYMFGSILSMTTGDVIVSVVLSIILVVIYGIFYNRLIEMILLSRLYLRHRVMSMWNKCNILSVFNIINNCYCCSIRNENDGNIINIKFNSVSSYNSKKINK